jgi:hypothetical protein
MGKREGLAAVGFYGVGLGGLHRQDFQSLSPRMARLQRARLRR